MDVFVVQHLRESSDGTEDVKFIGVYSSAPAAQTAVERLRSKPGFCEYPDGFSIDRYPVDQDHWTEGFGLGCGTE